MMFYDFTNVYLVNVNNALELANQSEHYIGLKHKPSDTINVHVCMYMIFYDREQQGNIFFFYKYVLICLGLAGKKSQGPSFLQPRVHYFPPYLTRKLTKS